LGVDPLFSTNGANGIGHQPHEVHVMFKGSHLMCALLRTCSAHPSIIALVSFFLGALPLGANAQIESSIRIVGDVNVPLCEINDTPGLRTLYVFHGFNGGMIASRFKIQAGPGVTMTYVSESHYFASTLGNTQDGISVCYGSCTLGDQLLASITYMAYGTSSSCSRMLVVPHPAAQTVEGIKCNGVATRTFVEDMALMHNNSGCGCPPTHGFTGTAQLFGCQPLPVANKTWGAIKALYAD
jgi:hypothetical protein